MLSVCGGDIQSQVKGTEMMKNQLVGEGTWTLSIFVTDLQVERNLRVRGDMHIGGVMIRLVDELGRNQPFCLTKYQ